jgi:hypothetical protein
MNKLFAKGLLNILGISRTKRNLSRLRGKGGTIRRGSEPLVAGGQATVKERYVLDPVSSVPPRPPTSWHYSVTHADPEKGPFLSCLSLSLYVFMNLSVFNCGQPHLLPLAHFLSWSSPLSPLVCPSYTWSDLVLYIYPANRLCAAYSSPWWWRQYASLKRWSTQCYIPEGSSSCLLPWEPEISHCSELSSFS